MRRRAQAAPLVVEGQSVAQVAALFHAAGHCVRTWRDRFTSEGHGGPVDRPRRGRPPKLGEAEQTFVQEALERDPADYGLPVTVWSIRDLQALLKREREVEVSVCTLHQVLHAMGYRYRRPRHDLTHRQDAEAVAATKQVLEWLRKRSRGEVGHGSREPASVRPVYIDECEVHTHPRLVQVWRWRGSPMTFPAAGEDHQFAVLCPGRRHRSAHLSEQSNQGERGLRRLPRPSGHAAA